MRFAKLMMAAGACALATTPVMAAPSKLSASASKLSISDAAGRVATKAGRSSKQDDNGVGDYVLPVVVTLAIGLGIYFAIENGDDEPASP